MWLICKETSCNVGDLGLIPRLGRVWRIPWTTVHEVTKSRTGLSDFHFHFPMCPIRNLCGVTLQSFREDSATSIIILGTDI